MDCRVSGKTHDIELYLSKFRFSILPQPCNLKLVQVAAKHVHPNSLARPVSHIEAGKEVLCTDAKLIHDP